MELSSPSEINEINDGSSSDSKNSTFRNTAINRKQLDEKSFTGFCTLLKDIEMPSFDSSIDAVEKILSISDESPQNLKVYDADLREGCSDNLTLSPLAGTDSMFLFEDCQKVLKALESERLISDKESNPSVFSKLTILDIDNLNDSLLDDFSKLKCRENEGQDYGPSVSTPKNLEKINENNVIGGCKATLNFNGTFDKSPAQRGDLSINAESEVILGKEESKLERKVCNTTFDKPACETEKSPSMDLTFKAGSPKNDDDPLNRTYEVVGNGSFIIDGRCTNLMDMESNALDTILGSNPSTPLSRGVKSYPDTKKLSKSTLKKRLSALNIRAKEDITLTIKENNNLTSGTENQQGSIEKTLSSLSSVDSQITKSSQLTKDQILSRLRKNNHPGSSTGVSGPMKAVPIASVKQIQEIEKRMTSTPDGSVDGIQRKHVNETNTSGERENKKPSLPSFGSFSSIGTDGPVIRDNSSEDFMTTPEVFRHRNKSVGPHITSTPTLFPSTFKFDADLGLGSAPTPITAPRVAAVKNINIEKNLNGSYVCKTMKENQVCETGGKRSFETCNQDDSPNSEKIEIESLRRAVSCEGQDEVISVSNDVHLSPNEVQSKSNSLLIREGKKYKISPQKIDVIINNLETKPTPGTVKEEVSEKLNSIQVVCSEVKDDDSHLLTSTAKDEIKGPKKGFSVYISEAEVEFEKLDIDNGAAGCLKHLVSPIAKSSINSLDDENILLNSENINSVKDSNKTLSNANDMIASYEKFCQKDTHNFAHEFKGERSTMEKSLKFGNNSNSNAHKVDNSTLSIILKPKGEVAKNPLRTSLSKNTSLTNKAINANNKVTPKPSSTSKRLSYKPFIKVDKKPSSTITRPDNGRVSIARYGGSRLVRPALKPINSTESNQTLKSKEPVLKQEQLNSKEKPKLPKTISKLKVPINFRTLPTPVSVNARILPTPVSVNARTLPTPKSKNNLPNTVSDKSKRTSDRFRSNFPSSRLTKFSSNKENDAPKSNNARRSVASGIRTPLTRTSIPVPRPVNSR